MLRKVCSWVLPENINNYCGSKTNTGDAIGLEEGLVNPGKVKPIHERMLPDQQHNKSNSPKPMQDA